MMGLKLIHVCKGDPRFRKISIGINSITQTDPSLCFNNQSIIVWDIFFYKMFLFSQAGKIHVSEPTKNDVSGYSFEWEDAGQVDCKVG